jgi:hypothetical protein
MVPVWESKINGIVAAAGIAASGCEQARDARSRDQANEKWPDCFFGHGMIIHHVITEFGKRPCGQRKALTTM